MSPLDSVYSDRLWRLLLSIDQNPIRWIEPAAGVAFVGFAMLAHAAFKSRTGERKHPWNY